MLINQSFIQDLSYIGVFLTFKCPLSCSYCLNHYGLRKLQRDELTAQTWIEFFNSLELPSNLPLTLQGGEPSSYSGFWTLLQELKTDLKIDLLTNLQFDLQKFVKVANREHFTRKAPYASIRVSFHPEDMNWSETLKKVLFLQKEGFRVGLYMVSHPTSESLIPQFQNEALALGIDFRLKEFLGEFEGRLYGQYKYDQKIQKNKVECRTTELLLSPTGQIHRCHRDLYAGENALTQIDKLSDFSLGSFRSCLCYGQCHPCDIKIKNNRFQEFGHTSVEIRELDDDT